MEFHCRLGTATGEVLEQVVTAESEARLRHEMGEKGLYVLSVRPRGLVGGPRLALPSLRRIAQREFLIFNQELATLLKAGMPLVRSLDLLRRRVATPTFRRVLDDVHDRVRGGAALSEAFEAHADLVPGVYTASLVAGEKSGTLEQVLRRYVAYEKVVAGVRRKTLSALIYPAILLGLSATVIAIIVVRAVPAFAGFYETFGRELPLATRVLIGLSDFVLAFWPLLLLGAVGAGLFLTTWTRVPSNRVRLDRWVLALPFLGPTAQKFATSQAARTLSTLLGGGIPLVAAVDVTARAVGNRHMAAELEAVGRRVREGESVAAAMSVRPVFPDVAVKMVEVGESTGALQEMLGSLADFYDEEIDTSLSRFVTLIEPILLVIMGLIIAILLLSLYLPVFQLSSVVGR